MAERRFGIPGGEVSEKIIPEMSPPTAVCLNPERWHAYDNMATELEVLALLGCLVAALKPKRILETGCYHGHATEQLAKATRINGFGDIFTCDTGAREVQITHERLLGYSNVSIITGTGLELINTVGGPIHFAFLDSGPDEIRCHELRALYPYLSAGAVVAIHDSGVHTFLREKYLPHLLRELEMQHIFFDTPRGLCLCRKKPEIYP
jgi:predicted O-methyltransferase YrrM